LLLMLSVIIKTKRFKKMMMNQHIKIKIFDFDFDHHWNQISSNCWINIININVDSFFNFLNENHKSGNSILWEIIIILLEKKLLI
jgi:hypothetical protein